MSTPIYAQDPFEGINKQLMQVAAMRQAQEAQKEDLKLRQAHLKLQQEQHAMEQQQQQTQQAGAIQSFLGALADPSMGQLTQPAAGMLGDARVSTPDALSQVNAVAAPQQMGGRVAPSMIDSRRAEQQFGSYMKTLKQHLPEGEFSQFEAAVNLVQAGVPKELVDSFIPETAKEVADRLKVLEETRSIADKTQSDTYAQGYLAKKYNISVGMNDANKMLQNLIMADRLAGQARSLESLRQQGDKANNLTGIENQLRDNFEKSPVVKSAQSVVQAYSNVVTAAARARADNSGPSDQALIFQFVHMQDNTAARDSERQAIQQAGSIENYITARFGKYKAGEVLADEVRQKLVKAAEDLLNTSGASLDAYMQHYGKIATGSGVDPARIMYNPITATKAKAEDDALKIRVRGARRP